MLIGKNRFKDLNEKEFWIAFLSNIAVLSLLACIISVSFFKEQKTFLDWMALEIAFYGVVSLYIVSSDAYIKQQHIGSYQWFLSKLNIKVFDKFSNKIIDFTMLFLVLNYMFLIYYIFMAIISKNLEIQILFTGAFPLIIATIIICFKEYLDGKVITEKELLLINDVDIFNDVEKQKFKNKLSKIIEKTNIVTRSDVQILFEEMLRNNIQNKKKDKALKNYKQILNKNEKSE